MSLGVLSPRSDAPINWVDPVNWLHSANRELLGWWYGLPGTTGSRTLVDLTRRSPGLYGGFGSQVFPSWTGTNRPGGYAEFNYPGTASGSAPYFLCGSWRGLEIQSNTFMAWVKPTNLSAQRMIAGRSDSIAAGGYEWSIDASGRPAWAYYDGSVRGWFNGTAAVTAGVWTHVAIVARVSAGAVDFYVNGKFDQTTSTGVTNPITHVATHIFDVGHASANAEWLGSLDDIRVSGCVMRADEIRRCYELSLRGWPGAINRIPLPRYAAQDAATAFPWLYYQQLRA